MDQRSKRAVEALLRANHGANTDVEALLRDFSQRMDSLARQGASLRDASTHGVDAMSNSNPGNETIPSGTDHVTHVETDTDCIQKHEQVIADSESEFLIQNIDDVAKFFGVPLSSLKEIDDFTIELEAGNNQLWLGQTMDIRSGLSIIVKIYDVPIQAFMEDGLSIIASTIGKHIMLDSYTFFMCIESWGRSSYARCLIEINAQDVLQDSLTIGIPCEDDRFSIESVSIEYEYKPPRCDLCKIFGYSHDYCPKKVLIPIVDTSKVITPNVGNISTIPIPSVEKTNDGFQTVGKKKKKIGKSKSNNGDQLLAPSTKQNIRYEPKASTSTPKKVVTNVGNTSNSSSLMKNTINSSNQDNITSSNSFAALNEDVEEGEVENVFDETANLFNSKTGRRSSFMAAVG
ncbi:zinc knuckle CX2CX4HX4C containing protein [Tanacetum coccineum]